MAEAERSLRVRDLGQVPYRDAWELQKELQAQRIADTIPDTLLVCEHPAVITLGRSADQANILLSKEELQTRNVEVFDIERGGDVTCHNPGQIVLYPILDLKNHKRDVDWYMRSLEEVVVRTLERLAIPGERLSGKTGVWVRRPDSTHEIPYAKIASIGVRISRWVTMHGLAVNAFNDLAPFAHINPCGFPQVEITSISSELEQNLKLSSTVESFPTIIDVKNNLLEEFSLTFNFTERINHAEKDVDCSPNSEASGTN